MPLPKAVRQDVMSDIRQATGLRTHLSDELLASADFWMGARFPVVNPVFRGMARRGPDWIRKIPAYAIGSLAAYWCFERIAALF